ncbi:recombinase family protein [Paracoccus versutus]|uniref:recombinase family protein n=2 Tax=Paracoccus versutus TaxID=34007 RepID=UPI003132DCAE
MSMIVGYARVSTDDQRLDLQLSALKDAGCEKIYQDHGFSGASMGRPGLEAALGSLRPGDTLVVWRLDRLGRSLSGLVQFVDELRRKCSQFRSLTESIDTNSSGGRLVFHIMAALAEFERALISERTKAGLSAAKQRGCRLGRPPITLSHQQIEEALRALDEHGSDMEVVAARYAISARTLRRRLAGH